MTKLLKRHKEGVIALVVSEPLATLVRQFLKHDELGDLWKAIGAPRLLGNPRSRARQLAGPEQLIACPPAIPIRTTGKTC